MSGVSSEDVVLAVESEGRQKVAWAYLARVALGCGPVVHLLVSFVGAEEAAALIRRREVSEELLRVTARSWEYSGAEADLEAAAVLGRGW